MIEENITKKILDLEKKYKNSGQDMGSYLDGLLYQRYLTYWDYIHLDTLLSLQVPQTHFPDEEIFILYHQITELYFKLIIHEQKQIIDHHQEEVNFLVRRIQRINNYYKALVSSFSIMINGMEKKQFLQYRMSLLPASGFQSAQFRMIEIYATPLENLLDRSAKDNLSKEATVEELFQDIYWKKGATNLETKEKTLTLKQFEDRYTPRFLRIANQVKEINIYKKYLGLSPKKQNNKDLIAALKELDVQANIHWPLMHMGSAYKYLKREKNAVQATGGTNWEKYLPPSFQKITFFPKIWSVQELEEWGKQWVTENF